MMKNIKLWAGILGVVFAVYLLLISCYEAAWNVLTMSGHFNGIAGIVIAVLLLAGSIVLFSVAAAIAFATTGIYHYMQNWAIICLVMGIVSVLMIMWKNSSMKQ